MANINRITVGGVTYNITIPDGLTEAEQVQIRENIGAISSADIDFKPDGTYPEMSVGDAEVLTQGRTIDGVEFNGSQAITHYGTCSTGAGTQQKNVTLAGFELVTGARITINFTVVNAVSSPTLNVNNTGAKPMKCKTLATGLVWKPEIMTLVYDGTYWNIIDGYSLWDKPVNKRLIQFDGESTPAARFGGTWEIDTDYTGRVFVGSGTGFTLGATGGEATHTQTVEEMPAHSHASYAVVYSSLFGETAELQARSVYFNQSSEINVEFNATALQHATTFKTADTSMTGQAQPFSIMQPYKAVAVWKRTA